jgi:type VI secretion system VasI family protein
MKTFIRLWLAFTAFWMDSAHSQEPWIVSEEQSPLDDSRNVYLSTRSLQMTLGTLRLPVTPTLHLRCAENTTSIFITWESFLDMESTEVTTRIDKLPAESSYWNVSTNFEAVGLWNGADAIPFIRSLFGHDRLLVRVTPYGDSPQTAVFNIEGLAEAAGPLMAACHWQAQTATGSQNQTATGSQKKAPQQDEFAALMRSVEEMDRQREGEVMKEGTGRSREGAGQARTELGEARLSIGEIDALMRQIGRCWTLPVGIDGVEDMVVQLRIQVRPDRTVYGVTIEDQARLNRDPEFRAVAESARRAVDACSPLNLPPNKYVVWRDIIMNFHPEHAISG